MSRQADQRKRDELVDQAAVILARSGIADTSLRALAADLGTTSRMLVHYFGTKEHLIRAVLARSQWDLTPGDRQIRTVTALRKRLLEDWEALTGNGFAPSGRLLVQILGAASSHDSPYAAYAHELLDRLTRRLTDRLTAIGLPSDVAEFRATITIAAVQGLIVRRANSKEPMQVDASFRRLLDTFVLVPTAPRQHMPGLFTEPSEDRLRQPRLR